jgi:uncharacterized coiled-coil DUF342 family protein
MSIKEKNKQIDNLIDEVHKLKKQLRSAKKKIHTYMKLIPYNVMMEKCT